MTALVVAAVTWWALGGRGEREESSQAGPVACSALAGAPGERLARCLAELDGVSLSEGAAREAREVLDEGALLVAGDRADLDVEQRLLAKEPGLQTLLLDDDEAAAADGLRDAGIHVVALRREIAGALDRDDAVIARLAYHDFLEWFQLRWVTSDSLLYGVRSTPMHVDDQVGDELLRGLRARLQREAPPAQSWDPGSVRLLGSIRLQGQTLAMRHAVGRDLESVLDDLAAKLRRRWERDVETAGLGPLEEHLADARLEVHVVLERADVDPRDEANLFDLWEPGVDGVMLTERLQEGELFGYMPGSEATPRGITSAEALIEITARDFGWPDARPWERDEVRLTFIRDEHFMERTPGGGAAVRMSRGMPTVSMDELTDETIRDMLVAGGEWWLRNQRPDGAFLYKYWPEQNRFSGEYNEVRHILAARDLVDAWRFRRDPAYLDGARRAMDWLLEYEVTAADAPDAALPHPDPGELLFRYPLRSSNGDVPNQKLGTVAVALMGWVNWAQATGDRSEDGRIRAMAEYTLSQAGGDGRFEPYNVPPGHPYHGQVNDIVPGEAALALGLVAEYFGEQRWVEFFPRFLDHYEPWFRERAGRTRPHGRWPHGTYENQTRLELVQFGPWAVMASRQYYELTGDERAASFGLEIADWLIDNYQWSGDRAPWPDYVGGYYKLPWELPAMQSFVYSEGTAAAYAIATTFSPETKDKYDLATRETLRFLRVMQYDPVDSYFAPRPEVVLGGVKYAMNEGKIRIDYLGHAMSTLSQYLDARAADPTVRFAITPVEVADDAPPRPSPSPPAEGEGDGEDRAEEPAE